MDDAIISLSTGPTRKQIDHLCGQTRAIAILGQELKRELLSLPRSSLLYARPGPPSRIFPEKNMPVDVLVDAMNLCQDANALLRSLGYLPAADDPAKTPE